MSLLDDVSIVVTPNGYKAGELYAVIPVPTEGAELVDCGNFECAVPLDVWAVQDGWTFSGNKANYAPNTGRTIRQTITTEIGKVYKISYEVSNWVANAVGAYVIESSDATTALYEGNADGNFSRTFTATGTSAIIRFRTSNTSANLSIDNASVKEVITASADMDVTRNTAATRVDENGLVNYAEVLGGDVVNTIENDNTYPFPTFTDNGGGSYTMATTTTSYSGFEQPASDVFAVAVGEIYKLTFDFVLNSGALDLELFIGSGAVGSSYGNRYTCQVGSNTAFITIITSNSSARLASQINSVANMTINNIVLKKVDRNNVPRIDYTGGGCPHILAEPMRTNLVTYSEDFSQTKWTGSPTTADVTVTTNTNPSGASGTYSVENVTGTQLGSFYTITSGVDYTNSFYVRNISGSGVISLKDINNSGTEFTATSEWQKFSVTGTSNSTTGRIYLSVTTLGDIVEVWGAQLEEGSYATSYIPNFGTALGVTRNQDIFTRDGIGSLINSTEGVLFAEIAALSDDGTYRYMGLTDVNADNRVIILYYTSSTKIRVLLSSGGTKYFDDTYAVTDITDFHKVAVKWKANDFALWVDGFERATESVGSAPIGLNTLALDQAGSNNWFGKVKQLQVYDTALTDEQLLQLTGESGTDFYESYAEMASALTYTIQ